MSWPSFNAFDDVSSAPKTPATDANSRAISPDDAFFAAFETGPSIPGSSPQAASASAHGLSSNYGDFLDVFDPLATSRTAPSPGSKTALSPSASRDLFAIFGADDPGTPGLGKQSFEMRSSTTRISTSELDLAARESSSPGQTSLEDIQAFDSPNTGSLAAPALSISRELEFGVSDENFAAFDSSSVPEVDAPENAEFGVFEDVSLASPEHGLASELAQFAPEIQPAPASSRTSSLPEVRPEVRPKVTEERVASGALPFVFDESILRTASEGQEAALFIWLHTAEAELRNLNKEAMRAIQASLERTLARILSLDVPKPTLPVARTIARIYSLLYTKGDRRTVFDTVAGLQLTLSPTAKGAVPPPLPNKIAIVYVLGVLTLNFGDGIGSLFATTASVLAKLSKSGNDSVLRYEAFQSLTRSLEGSGRSASEVTAKEIVKATREGIRDRSLAIRTAAVECMDSLLKNTHHGRPIKVDDLDALLLPLVKHTLEGSSYGVRRSTAALIGTIMAFSLLPPPVDPRKKPAGAETGPPKPLMTISESLSFLAQYLLKYSSHLVRIGIIEGYAAFFRALGQSLVESSYSDISTHIIELSCHPKLCTSRAATLATRDLCRYLLRNVVSKMLTEPGQNQAIKILNENWLKKWPPQAGAQGPHKAALVMSLHEVASLLNDVGPAAIDVAEVVEPLGNLLNHLSRSVNAAVCWTLRSLCLSAPHNISRLISRIVPWLKKEAANLAADQLDRIKRFRGYALALGSLISVVPHRPLYVSFELCAKVLALAVYLFKQAAQSGSQRVAGVQAEVAWILVASLMRLGPDFVKVHLGQITAFWRGHFEKYGRDRTWVRNNGERQMVMQITDAALAAVQAFLLFNGTTLVTAELGRRIGGWLSDIQGSLEALQRTGKPAGDQSNDTAIEDLWERELHIRGRIFRCSSLLFQTGHHEATVTLLSLAVNTFAPAEAGEIRRTSYVRGLSIDIPTTKASEDRGISRIIVRDLDVKAIEEQAVGFAGLAPENDPYGLLLRKPAPDTGDPRRVSSPAVPAVDVDVVDAAIDVFGQSVVTLGSSIQEKLLDDVLRNVRRAPKGNVDVLVNSLAALFNAIKHAFARQGNIATGRVPELLRDLCLMGLYHANSSIRVLASEGLGRLCQVVNVGSFTSALTQQLVQAIVDIREPSTRAGAALALGSIQSYGGSLTGMTQLRQGFGILQSLAMDSHPTVHTWALVGILMMVEGSGLVFSAHVQATLDLVFKVLASEAHHGAAPGSADGNEYLGPILAHILTAVLNVIGPELVTKAKLLRDLCRAEYEDMRHQTDPFVASEAMRSAQQFILFDPNNLDTATLVPYIQTLLAQDVRLQVGVLRKSCVTCLYQLAKRSPAHLLEHADALEEQLFGLLDTEGEEMVRDEIKDVLREVIRFSAFTTPSRWIDLCKRILSSTSPVSAAQQRPDIGVTAGAIGDAGDDDSSMLESGDMASFSAPSAASISAAITLTPRWRTHLFALSCVRQLVEEVVQSGRKEHLDLFAAREFDEANGGIKSDLVIHRLADVIRIAFSAATAAVNDLRLAGLDLLQDVLEGFAGVLDPDFEGHSLLEQYQAQISSALSPALSNDAVVEISSAACRVSAVYVASGINQDLSTLSRVLRLLQELLKKVSGAKSEGSDVQPHATAMLRLAVQAAWARLAISTVEQEHLKPTVKPHLAVLTRLWFKTLREYGRISLENDVLRSLGGFPLTIDVAGSLTYLEATRNVILPFYDDSWLFILRAFTSSLMEEGVMTALMGQPNGAGTDSQEIFTILCGLCLRSISTEDSHPKGPKAESRDDVMVHALKAIASLVDAGDGLDFLSQDFALAETLAVLNRSIDTVPSIRPSVASTLRSIVAKVPSDVLAAEAAKGGPLESGFLNIFVALLAYCLPGFSSTIRRDARRSEETVSVVLAAFSAWLVKVPEAIKTTAFQAWIGAMLSGIFDDVDQGSNDRSSLLVSFATVAKILADRADLGDFRVLLVSQVALLAGDEGRQYRRHGPSGQYHGMLLKLFSIIIVTLPDAAIANRLAVGNALRCAKACLGSGDPEAIAPCLQFLAAAFSLLKKSDALAVSVGTLCVRELLPLLHAAVASRVRRIYTEPQANAVSVPIELFSQIAVSPIAELPEEPALALLRATVLALTELLAPSSGGEDSYLPSFCSAHARQLHIAVVRSLVSLAAENPTRFRAVVGTLEVRATTRLRGALEGGQKRPTIELKSFA